MKATTATLSATLNETDRRLVAAAIQSHVFESRAQRSGPGPLGYSARLARTRYAAELRQLERRLRMTAATLNRWRVAVEPRIAVTSLGTIFEQRQVVAPVAVRRQLARNDFMLVRVTGRLALDGGVPLRSLHLDIEFDPDVKARSRRAQVYSLFPRTEGRTFHGGHVIFALRPNLTFWVPRMPGGVAYVRSADVNDLVRRMMLLGPMKMAFRKVSLVGYGAGTNRAEWVMSAGRQAVRTAGFEVMMVIRVARNRSSIKAAVSLDAEVAMPAALAGVTGRRRHLRDSGHWNLALPRPAVRAPSRTD